jgi:hypothetical protein
MKMENVGRIDFKQQRDFSSLLNATFAFLKQEFKPLVKLLIIKLAPLMLLIGIFTALSADNVNNNISSNPFALLSIYYVGQMITTLFFFLYLQSIVLHYIKHYNSDSVESREEYIKNNAMSRIFDLFKTNLLYGILVAISSVLFIIPGIYVFVIFSLAYVIKILSDGEIRVFKKSSDLIKNHWWETFGGLFVIFIVYYIISFVFALPGVLIYLTDLFTGASDMVVASTNNLILDIIMNIIASVGLLSVTLMYVFLSFNYYS